MNATVRATIILLAFRWPKHIPLTRAWCVEILYIMDKAIRPGCLGLDWDTRHVYPINKELLQDLDKLGCISAIQRSLTEEMVQMACRDITSSQSFALEIVATNLSSCDKVIEAYEWKNKMKMEIVREQEEN